MSNELLLLHQSLWANNSILPILIDAKQQSYIKFQGMLLVKQNPGPSLYGRMVERGKQVTLVIQTNQPWGVFIDNTFELLSS